MGNIGMKITCRWTHQTLVAAYTLSLWAHYSYYRSYLELYLGTYIYTRVALPFECVVITEP